MVWLTIVSCSNQNKSNDNAIDLTSSRSVENSFNFIEDYDFTAGVILSFTKVNENEYIFLDLDQRALFLLDTTDRVVRQVGRQGEGPGEYRNPIHFQKAESDEIAFTDITNMSIKFIGLDGSFVNRIDHKLGGGKQFVLNDDEIFLLGRSSNNQLIIIDRQGNIKEEFFPIKNEYENQVKNLGMGGITMIGDKIFFMNIIEPVIYVLNIKTNETQEVSPFDREDEMFTLNDGVSLINSDSDELRTIYSDGGMVVFQRVGKIKIKDEIHLAISARKGDDNFAYFLDQESLEIKYIYSPSKTIIGFSEQYVYENNIYSGTGIVEEVSFSLNSK